MYAADIEALPRHRLKQLQDQKISRLVQYAYGRVEFYRQMFDKAGIRPKDVRGVEDLARLPFTRKDDLRSHYPFGLLAVEPSRLARIHVSSGTTGKPTVVGYTAGDLETFAEVNARSLLAAGARSGMKLHNAYGYGLFTGGLGLHAGAEKLGMAVIPVSGGMTARQIMLIQDFRPEVISCTPSYAQTLAWEFRRRGISPLQISLRYAVLGAEPWSDAIRKDVESGLGVQATNLYGLSEIIGPGVSQECLQARDGSHVWEDHFYPEVVHPESGEPLGEGAQGVLILTTLSKEAMPLIRYWTGDITYLTRQPCICGRTHARMGPVKGRTDDMLIVRGVNLYPAQIESALDGLDQLSPHYQLILTREGALDQLELRIEVTPEAILQSGRQEFDAEALKALQQRVRQQIKDNVGLRVQVTLLAPGQAPRSEGGKLSRVEDRREL